MKFFIVISLAALILAEDGLNIRAKAARKLYFGTATDNPLLTDVPYVARLKNTSDFGQITVGNTQKVYNGPVVQKGYETNSCTVGQY
jgi:hypothetical protein